MTREKTSGNDDHPDALPGCPDGGTPLQHTTPARGPEEAGIVPTEQLIAEAVERSMDVHWAGLHERIDLLERRIAKMEEKRRNAR